jgi:hypothetical protein
MEFGDFFRVAATASSRPWTTAAFRDWTEMSFDCNEISKENRKQCQQQAQTDPREDLKAGSKGEPFPGIRIAGTARCRISGSELKQAVECESNKR